MKKLVNFFTTYSMWVQYHLIATSLFLTGLFIGFTSEETGPLAPMVVFLGTYVMFAAVIMEAVWLLRIGAAFLFSHFGDKEKP